MTNTETALQNDAGNETKPARTPHELATYHLTHPNEEITDDDIRNLKIDSGAVAKEHQINIEEYVPAKEHTDAEENEESGTATATAKEEDTEDEKITTPYDVLGGS